jgi:predicted ATPase/DNA-binding SARP family transcriptional activator
MPPSSPTTNPPSFHLYLCGSFILERAGQPVRLTTRKAESLLAYLALHPGEHSRETLAAAFWGESPDEDARRSLRVALTSLRKLLGEETFEATRTTLRFNPNALPWVDALVFKAQAEHVLAQAHNPPDARAINLDLYRGPLLNDFFDEWVPPLRETYEALYVETLLRLVSLARAQSDYRRAIELAQRILVVDPAHETAHQHIMVCYAAGGQRVAALKQYEDCVRLLALHLAVDPSPETTALYKQLQDSTGDSPGTAAAQTNLPVLLTSFVGRTEELKQINNRLSPPSSTRLLTVLGSGGTGKTRLVIQAAQELVSHLSGGVWWVELAALQELGQVGEAIATALGITGQALRGSADQLPAHLRALPTLLVLDNCEHLLSACAELVPVLLKHCPKLSVLATSREPLGVTGEITLPLQPLFVPTESAHAANSDSVRLLVDRGRAVNASFTLTPENTAAVIQVCRRLDGIPLAIELAAAQLNRLSVEQIVERLDDRFRLLVDGGLSSLPRHQTLRALIDWSHGLLLLPERVLFRRLAVFSGGWTLEAAIVVAGGYTREQALEEDSASALSLAPLTVSPRDMVRTLLAHLIEKSLVAVQLQAGERRFGVLDSILAYANAKLLEADELAAMQARHFNYFLQLANLARPKLRSVDQLPWLKLLEAEHDNIRAALALALESVEVTAYQGLQLATALLWFWHIRGHRAEGFNWLKKLLAVTILSPESSPAVLSIRAHALHAAGRLTDAGEQLAMFEESLALFRTAQDEPGIGVALGTLAEFHGYNRHDQIALQLANEALPRLQAAGDKFAQAQLYNNVLGLQALAHNDYEQASAAQLEAAALRMALGDKDGLAWSYYQLGRVAAAQGALERAYQYYEQSLPLWREVENFWLVQWSLNRMGFLALRQNETEKARHYFREGLQLALVRGNKVGCALGLNGWAGAAWQSGQQVEAVRLLGALELPFSDPEERWDSDDFADYQRQVAVARASLSPAEFSAAWQTGQTLNVSELAAAVAGNA